MTKKAMAVLAVVLGVSLTAGCATAGTDDGGTKTNASGKHGKKSKDGGSTDSGPDNSTATNDGPMTWEGWQVASPVQLKDEQYSHDYTATIRVKNTQQSKDEGYFTITVLKGRKVLGTLDCSTATIGPGQVGTADCTSMDKFVPGWTEITIENGF